MLFFNKKKLCPYCNKEMQEFKEYWTCNPCEYMKKYRQEFLIEHSGASGIPPSESYREYKTHSIKNFVQRIKDAVYVFKHGMDE